MKIYEAKVNYSIKGEISARLLNTSEDTVDYMAGAFDEYPEQESFWVIFLNRKNRPIGRQMLSLGNSHQCIACPRDIFKAILRANASSFICVHNHPSGDPAPSSQDIRFTRQLREAAQVLEIPFVDHVIIGEKESDPNELGHYSFRKAGMI